MSSMSILLVCLGMGAVTYVPRVLPLLLFADKEMPNWLKEVLKFVPVAMLSALVAKDVFFKDDALFMTLANPKILALLVLIPIAAKFKSITISLVVGVASILLFATIL